MFEQNNVNDKNDNINVNVIAKKFDYQFIENLLFTGDFIIPYYLKLTSNPMGKFDENYFLAISSKPTEQIKELIKIKKAENQDDYVDLVNHEIMDIKVQYYISQINHWCRKLCLEENRYYTHFPKPLDNKIPADFINYVVCFVMSKHKILKRCFYTPDISNKEVLTKKAERIYEFVKFYSDSVEDWYEKKIANSINTEGGRKQHFPVSYKVIIDYFRFLNNLQVSFENVVDYIINGRRKPFFFLQQENHLKAEDKEMSC